MLGSPSLPDPGCPKWGWQPAGRESEVRTTSLDKLTLAGAHTSCRGHLNPPTKPRKPSPFTPVGQWCSWVCLVLSSGGQRPKAQASSLPRLPLPQVPAVNAQSVTGAGRPRCLWLGGGALL